MPAPPAATIGTLSPAGTIPGIRGAPANTVLLVEDDELVAKLFSAILEREHLRVLQARDGSECLRLFEENQAEVALVLMDCSLPDTHGGTLCHRIRVAAPGLPILLTSGRNQAPLHSLLAADGPTGFLSKPFLPSELLRDVKSLLSRVARG